MILIINRKTSIVCEKTWTFKVHRGRNILLNCKEVEFQELDCREGVGKYNLFNYLGFKSFFFFFDWEDANISSK